MKNITSPYEMKHEVSEKLKNLNENTGIYNSGWGNSGKRNLGDDNSGDGNSGDGNSGNLNSGNRNSGGRNPGYLNTGSKNEGNFNTGDMNRGDKNTGVRNFGCRNTGGRNLGDKNSGNNNVGNMNSGDGNKGHMNSGDYNDTNFSNGVFCTEEENIKFFNKPSDMIFRDWLEHPARALLQWIKLVRWVDDMDMTEQEKINNDGFRITGGFFKKITLQEAAKHWKRRLTDMEIETIKTIPNFDNDIFEEILGIRL